MYSLDILSLETSVVGHYLLHHHHYHHHHHNHHHHSIIIINIIIIIIIIVIIIIIISLFPSFYKLNRITSSFIVPVNINQIINKHATYQILRRWFDSNKDLVEPKSQQLCKRRYHCLLCQHG